MATDKLKRNDQKTINLVEGSFTPSEAATLVNELIDVKLNFHKLKRLSLTEGDMQADCNYDSSRIEELLEEKLANRQFFKEAKAQGKRLVLKSTLEIITEDD